MPNYYRRGKSTQSHLRLPLLSEKATTEAIARATENAYVIALEPISGIRINAVARVPRTFPSVDTAYTTPDTLPTWSRDLVISRTITGDSVPSSDSGTTSSDDDATRIPSGPSPTPVSVTFMM